MSATNITEAFVTYGYSIIFICAFFGIIGIPAPEESLLVIIGMACVHHTMDFTIASVVATSGTIVGMLTGYCLGKYLGLPILLRFGHLFGFTVERFASLETKYKKHSRIAVMFGFYLPGIRQLSPYVAGTVNLRFPLFLLYASIGALLWVIPYMAAGYFIGSTFSIPPAYVSSIGFILFGIFILHLIIQGIKKKVKGANT